MNLVALPAFADNYIWMLDDGLRAVVVDPGDAVPVLDALDQRSLQLAGILVTHRRSDHLGADVQAFRPHNAEWRIKPFLRCDGDTVVDSALAHGALGADAVEVFAALHEWKNRCR